MDDEDVKLLDITELELGEGDLVIQSFLRERISTGERLIEHIIFVRPNKLMGDENQGSVTLPSAKLIEKAGRWARRWEKTWGSAKACAAEAETSPEVFGPVGGISSPLDRCAGCARERPHHEPWCVVLRESQSLP